MNAEEAKIINRIFDEDVRPKLLEHDGNIELVDIRDGVAYVRMLGHCSGCPSAMYTLESIVKEEVLAKTDIVQDVKLHYEVSDELLDFAKSLMKHGN